MKIEKLYKYYSLNSYSISSVVNHFVYYSSANDFNDPFDTKILDIQLLQKASFEQEKFFCMSGLNDNILMWSHYSNCHKGFCVEYSDFTDKEIQSLKIRGIFPNDAPNEKLGIIRNARKVQYMSTSEIEDIISQIPHDEKEFLKLYKSLKTKEEQKSLIDKIQKTSFIKHNDWCYEKEYRIVNTKSHISHAPGKISAVYFGLKMSSIDKRTIGILLNPKFDSTCKLFQMYREPGTFSLKHRDFDMKKDLDGIGIVY
ncbi:MAG: DUF2971 domain-containing protein [Bacteroidetes bacterium]|nr:DUF2971 domain-containing protein [Bacteroidota bacterium]MBK9672785.1 DUF2971 domain-containing protein [Bacteroidota bacterium]MBK9800900.1 DUF2971 domain-containing protein [Bacteroidota bacterium]MBP6412044.1 DUF2971 domain-containing protein [Bacteroidia bacterium]